MKHTILIGFMVAGCEGAGPPTPADESPLAGGHDPPELPTSPWGPDAGSSDAGHPAPDAGRPLPDLTLLVPEMTASLAITWEGFAPDHCAVDECLGGPGMRRLLRFATGAANTGAADLVLGRPTPSEDEWEYDACHQHYHYLNFASYQLVSADEGVVAVGRKQSFCLRDDRKIDPAASAAVYDCTNQGLSVGWADVYAASLDCQFIDITDVAPGAYMLRIELNPEGVIEEARLDNNVALIPVTID
jgi:hypothetical protein